MSLLLGRVGACWKDKLHLRVYEGSQDLKKKFVSLRHKQTVSVSTVSAPGELERTEGEGWTSPSCADGKGDHKRTRKEGVLLDSCSLGAL